MNIIFPEEFVKRLDIISEANVKYLHLLITLEHSHKVMTRKYKGHYSLSRAFKSFFLKTIREVNMTEKTTFQEEHILFIPRMVNSFQTFCAAEIAANQGYPLQGYILLRNIFDNLILLSAVIQGYSDFNHIEGIKPGTVWDLNSIKKLRKSAEYGIRKKMTGDNSGLSKTAIEELKKWDDLFDYETHGSRLSFSYAEGWLKGVENLPVLPEFKEKAFTMFMNRYCEIGWIIHRLIPFLQIPNYPLSDKWGEEWRIIDESFENSSEALTSQANKKIGIAFVELVKTKFPFNEKSNLSVMKS